MVTVIRSTALRGRSVPAHLILSLPSAVVSMDLNFQAGKFSVTHLSGISVSRFSYTLANNSAVAKLRSFFGSNVNEIDEFCFVIASLPNVRN